MDSVFMQCFVGCLFAFILMFVSAYQFVLWRIKRWAVRELPELVRTMIAGPDGSKHAFEMMRDTGLTAEEISTFAKAPVPATVRVTCDDCGLDVAVPVIVTNEALADRTAMKSVQQASSAWLRNNHWKPVLGAWQCPDCAVISAG